MKHFLKILLALSFVLAFQHLKAQTVGFEYDAAGNCVVKYKTVVMSAHRASQPSEEETEISEISPENQPLADRIGEVKITLFPNPTKDLLLIEFEHKSVETVVNYTLTNLNGKYLTGGKSADNPLNLDLSAYATGAYLLRISINGKKGTYKIIKL